ncbi:protein-tyrosine-phosphatase [Coemansia interrupta]|uniref:Protein-tyrosine-phosphatase n=1 Tax=Coemansia interrupta TaxID=1126814 RepID=A0A9W8HHB4_9FUNG|nr:protein-tyrosine-phosphatase [Coemansia interrupta]
MSDIIDPLIPPYRFERVQDRLYRGGYPKPRNFRFLKRQRLKTILSLIPQNQDPHLTSFCHANSIALLTIKVDSPNENVTVTNKIASQCLELLTNPAHAPLYLHCLDGSNVTGLIIMCLRKLQLWRVASYQNEYLRFELNGEIIPEESEFVEAYDGAGLVLSNPYAEWVWPGRTSLDVNLLPFDNGVHPVLPAVRLAQRMSTEICVADPLTSLNRSATDPALREGVEDIVSESTSIAIANDSGAVAVFSESPGDIAASTEGSIQMMIKTRRTASDTQNPNPARTAAPQILSSTTTTSREPTKEPVHRVGENAGTKLPSAFQRHNNRSEHGDNKKHHRRMVSDAEVHSSGAASDRSLGSLHTSLSTGALTEVLSSARQSDSDAHSQTQASARQPLSSIHEVLEPVLAALSSARDFAESSAQMLESRGRANGADSSSGAVPVSAAENMAQLYGSATTAAATAGATVSETEASGAIREIPLSALVDALAIEGLGM